MWAVARRHLQSLRLSTPCRWRKTEKITNNTDLMSSEVAVTDWSGKRFDGPEAERGSDQTDQDPAGGIGPRQHGPNDRARDLGSLDVSPSMPTGQPRPVPPGADHQIVSGSPAFRWPQVPTARTSRNRLLIVVMSVGAMLVAAAVVLVLTVADRRDGQAAGSAGDAVRSYLEALARGDAETALSYGTEHPAITEFLNSDTLKMQIAQWPIHNIRILHDNSTAPNAALSMAHVHVVVTFGDQTSDATLDLRTDDNRWKLASAAFKFTPGLGASVGNAAAKTLTLFGKPISASTVYVFPGWIDIGTTSAYLTVTVQPLLLEQLTPMAPFWVHPTFALSDKGRAAVSAQLAIAMANCQKSNLLAPRGCPVNLESSGLAEGTAAWGSADLSAVKLNDFDPYRLTVTFSGQVTVPVTARTSAGATKQEDVIEFLSGTADMAKMPPELTFQ